MTIVNSSYVDFSGGEISPKFYGRFDTKFYYNSGRRICNFIPDTVGVAVYRQGTYYVSQTAGNAEAFLYPFVYTDNASFAIEFTPLKMRFYYNDNQVRATAQNITNITKANPAVVTYSGSDTYANGDSVWIENVGGMTQVNGREFTVANVNAGANTFELSGVNSTGYGTYTSGGTVAEIIELPTPYVAADLETLKFAQDNDVLYIAHPNYQPRKLTYTNPSTWALTTHAPIRKTRQPGVLISAISQANPGVVTYTGSDIFINGDEIYIDNCAGMTQLNGRTFTVAGVNTGANTFQLTGEDTSGYGTYSGGGLVRRVTSASAPFLTAGNYPSAVGFYEQRLIYGGSNNEPNKLFFSKPGENDDFSLQQGTTPEIDDGLEYVIAGSNKINWLRGTDRFLAVGALNDVFQITGGADGVITGTSIAVRPSNSFGVANIVPIGKGNQIFYVQSNGLTIRSFEYDFERDSYIPVDRNTIADHITVSGLKQLDFQEGRPNIVWGVRNDGRLVGMTLEQQESVSGWHWHKTDGEVVSLATLPRANKYDQLWLCVKRTINGVTKHYIEFLTEEPVYPRREDFVLTTNESADNAKYRNMLFEAQRKYIHLDCALSYYGELTGLNAGASVTPAAVSGTGIVFTASASVFTASMVGRRIVRKSITGAEIGVARITAYTSGTSVTCTILESFNSISAIPAGEWYLTSDELVGCDHLEGKLVSVVTDGGKHPDVTVTNGTVNLDNQYAVVHIGLPYVGTLETNDLEGGGINGTAQTKKKNLFKFGFRFLDTLYAKYGSDYYRLNQIEMRTTNMLMNRPPELFTGDIIENYTNQPTDNRNGGWPMSARAIVQQDLPFPCKVQLIVPYYSVSN